MPSYSNELADSRAIEKAKQARDAVNRNNQVTEEAEKKTSEDAAK